MSRSAHQKTNADRNNYMSEETKTKILGDEEESFKDQENENSSSSSEGEENDSDNKGSSSSENGDKDVNNKDTKGEKDGGFLNHPRWKEREEDWNKRFNGQEERHQNDLKALREEFGGARKENREQVEIPSWFGGDQEQWNAYRQDRDTEIKQAEERAINRLKGEESAKEKAIKEATDYMQKEIAAIENDPEINPDGTKVDPNKLLKFVLDNDLVDSKGRWNYKAGFKLMNTGSSKPSNFGNKDRKAMAGATTSESKAEDKPRDYKTSQDFKGNNRPW